MNGRYDELKKIAENLRSGDFEKIAMDEGMRKEAQDPMVGGAMPPPAPGSMPMMDPSMMPPAEGAAAGSEEGAVAAQGMTEVALRALDLTQGVIGEALQSDSLTPADKVDASAAALETSGALQGIPPEEIAALAQSPAPPAV